MPDRDLEALDIAVDVDGRVYVSAGYPPAKPIYAVRPGRRGAFDLAADSVGDQELIDWSHERGGAYMPTPIRYRGRLWIVHHNARLVAYDLADPEHPVLRRRQSVSLNPSGSRDPG